MKLRPRLTLLTVLLVVAVVAFTSFSTIMSFQYFLRREMISNQRTLFENFKQACHDTLYYSDDLGLKIRSESFERSIPGLAYAVFVDEGRGNLQLGGVESLRRFKKQNPVCEETPGGGGIAHLAMNEANLSGERWRTYCQKISLSNIKGKEASGSVFVGFNMNLLDSGLKTVIDRMWAILMWTMVIVLFFGVILAYFLAMQLTKPILHLTEGAKAIGDGHLDTHIPVNSADELGFLANEFNTMASRLRELDQLKDDFLSSVSHELRSPLAAISGYVELLRNKPLEQILPEKRAKALQIISESVGRLTHFINDILDLAKLKSGHVEIKQQPLDLKEAGEDIFGLFQPLLENKSISWSLDIPDDISVLIADDDKIRQVLTNLVSNALKFTPSGGTIKMSARNQTEFIQISVRDSGIGVPSDGLEAAFERFKQVKSARDHVVGQKGTGLGLAIAKGIVEAHGGRIWMESELGKGTTVFFTVPNKPAPKLNIAETV